MALKFRWGGPSGRIGTREFESRLRNREGKRVAFWALRGFERGKRDVRSRGGGRVPRGARLRLSRRKASASPLLMNDLELPIEGARPVVTNVG